MKKQVDASSYTTSRDTTLQGNRLKVSGCKLGLCKSQLWTRVR